MTVVPSASPVSAVAPRVRGAVVRALTKPLPAAALVILILVLAAALLAPWLSPYDPNQLDLAAILAPPSSHHLLGTDHLGRDLWTRVLFGARPSIAAGVAIVALGSLGGLILGSASGLIGGRVDMVIMRLMDVMLALPGMVVALALTAALGPNLFNAVVALAVLSIPGYTRVVRGQALAIRQQDFVQAARTLGAGPAYLIRWHIAPNVMPALVIFMTFHLGGALLATSALSFIGLGMQPPAAEWGAMIGDGRAYVLVAWWVCVAPGLAIVATAMSVNILGDAMRDILDPKAMR